MYINRQVVAITTNTSGAATAYTPVVNGRLSSIQYVKDDFTDGVDFTITTEITAQTLWTTTDINASAIVAPRQPLHTGAAVAVTYDGTNPIYDHICVDNERVKIVIASGGSAKSGTFHVTLV